MHGFFDGGGCVEIRLLHPDEHDAWLRLRERLWPLTPPSVLADERAELVADSSRNAVLVAASSEELVGFVEVSIRDWAEGCASRPVGYIEAWYVVPERRVAGLGRRLVEAAEAWAITKGCTEMGSDTDLSNGISHAAHRALGYGEVARLVLFSKRLTSARQPDAEPNSTPPSSP